MPRAEITIRYGETCICSHAFGANHYVYRTLLALQFIPHAASKHCVISTRSSKFEGGVKDHTKRRQAVMNCIIMANISSLSLQTYGDYRYSAFSPQKCSRSLRNTKTIHTEELLDLVLSIPFPSCCGHVGTSISLLEMLSAALKLVN